jgi:hypothetical protein
MNVSRTVPAIAIVIVSALIASPRASASPFAADRVPVDAKWVAHLDVQAALKSDLGTLVVEDLRAMGLDDGVRKIRAVFGVDPLTGFAGITMFGRSYNEDDAVIVIEAVTNTARLEELVEAGDDYRKSSFSGRTVHSWVEGKGKAKGERKYGVVDRKNREGSSLIIIANDRERLTGTLDVIDGRKASLLKTPREVLKARPDQGSMLYIAADDVAEAAKNKDAHSAMVRTARSLIVDIGEQKGVTFIDMQVKANTPQQAHNIQQMIRGMLAAVSMAQETPDHPFAKLADAVEVNAAESTALARFTYESKTLYAELKALQAEREAEAEAATQAPIAGQPEE